MMRKIECLILLFLYFGVLAMLSGGEESISSSSFYGQLADFYSHVLSLIHPVDEFSFKEIRRWGQYNILSCCLCVWCRWRERGSRGESKILNNNGGKLLQRPSSNCRKLLDRLAFRILSNINDGALYVACRQMIGLMVVTFMVFFTCGNLVLVFCGVETILRSDYEI